MILGLGLPEQLEISDHRRNTRNASTADSNIGMNPSQRYPPVGRILGDTVREQEGEAVFDIVERVPPDGHPLRPRRRPAAGPNWPPCSTRCRAIPPSRSSAPSATSCNWPTSPRRTPHPPPPRPRPGWFAATRRQPDPRPRCADYRPGIAGSHRRFLRPRPGRPVLTAHPTGCSARA